MTTPNPEQTQAQEQKPNDKEHNFRALEQKMLQERNARLEAEKRALEAERVLQERQSTKRDSYGDDEEDSSEPYVDHKRLSRAFTSFEKRMDEKIERKAEEKSRHMIEDNKRSEWMKRNPDFYDVLQHAEKFAAEAPELAETILEMPEGFERQKLVYNTIKKMGMDKPAQKQSSIQDKVDANRKSPYYQPSGIGAAPYGVVNGGKDYSPAEGKNAYLKMKELQSRLRR